MIPHQRSVARKKYRKTKKAARAIKKSSHHSRQLPDLRSSQSSKHVQTCALDSDAGTNVATRQPHTFDVAEDHKGNYLYVFNRDICGLDEQWADQLLCDYLCSSGVGSELFYALNESKDVDIRWLGTKSYAAWRIHLIDEATCDRMVMFLQAAASDPEVIGMVGGNWDARKWENQRGFGQSTAQRELSN